MCIKSLLSHGKYTSSHGKYTSSHGKYTTSHGKYTSCCNIMFRAIAKHTAGQNIDKWINVTRTAESTAVSKTNNEIACIYQ